MLIQFITLYKLHTVELRLCKKASGNRVFRCATGFDFASGHLSRDDRAIRVVRADGLSACIIPHLWGKLGVRNFPKIWG